MAIGDICWVEDYLFYSGGLRCDVLVIGIIYFFWRLVKITHLVLQRIGHGGHHSYFLDIRSV